MPSIVTEITLPLENDLNMLQLSKRSKSKKPSLACRDGHWRLG